MNRFPQLSRPFGGINNAAAAPASSDPASSGGGKMSASKILSGGMPCKFELTMEFFCTFLFTFIIYFFFTDYIVNIYFTVFRTDISTSTKSFMIS